MALKIGRTVFDKICVFLKKAVGRVCGNMAEKECPLQFHDFRPVDHGKMCPRYWAVTQRTEDEGIGVEELDTLQLELETLLAAASKRMRQLEAETQVLIDWQEKKDKKGGGKIHKSESVSSGKRGRPPDDKHEKPSKKFKESSGKLGASTSHSGPGRPKTKNIQQKLQEYEFTDDPLDVPRIPKNDAPNRFWASLEPYCADITSEDLKSIEELMKSNEDDSEYYKIPPLGKHYTIRWAQEDLIEEQKEGHRVNDKKRGSALGNSTSPNTNDAKSLMKKADIRDQSEDICPFGPLTQRLISALVEENIMTPLDDLAIIDAGSKGDNAGNDSNTSPRNGNRPFTVPHTRALEARIREELLYQGLLDTDDQIGEDTDDEVLAELKKRQAELKALSAHNKSQKQKLHRLAKEEIKKQELRQKARSIDNDVMEAYRRIQAARQKKRSPTKKERDSAMRALREREQILKLLDS